MGVPTRMAEGLTEQWGAHVWATLEKEYAGRAGGVEEDDRATRAQYLLMWQDEQDPLPGLSPEWCRRELEALAGEDGPAALELSDDEGGVEFSVDTLALVAPQLFSTLELTALGNRPLEGHRWADAFVYFFSETRLSGGLLGEPGSGVGLFRWTVAFPILLTVLAALGVLRARSDR